MRMQFNTHFRLAAALMQDPGGGLARAGLQAVVGHLGRALGSPASWQHRELRNPLGDASLPPLLQLSSGAALAVQSLCNNLLLANVSGRQPVQGMLLLYGPYLLWSTLAARDTAALFALLATGLLHATSTSKSCKPTNGSQADGVNAAASDGGSPAAVHPDLRALDGGWWQQLPSGFLVQRGAKEARAAATAAAVDGAAQPAVPLVHLQHGPMGQGQGQVKGQQQQQQGSSGGDGQWVTHHLLPLLEGRLLLVMLLGTDTQLSAELLADLHDWVAGPAKQLATQVRRWRGRLHGRLTIGMPALPGSVHDCWPVCTLNGLMVVSRALCSAAHLAWSLLHPHRLVTR